MDKFPIIITAGGMLLGWIAGTMAHTDPALVAWLPQTKLWNYGLGVGGALLVYVVGWWLNQRKEATA